jgi:hypothetical protein
MIGSVGGVLEEMITKVNARIDKVERALNDHIHPPKPERPQDGEFWNIKWNEKNYSSDITVLVIRTNYPATGPKDGDVRVHVRLWGDDRCVNETYECWVALSEFNYKVTDEEVIESFWNGEWD